MFDFEAAEWPSLWHEVARIVLFWIPRPICIFRVDNPQSKALLLWEWLIAGILAEQGQVVFRAELSTRPEVIQRLAKI